MGRILIIGGKVAVANKLARYASQAGHDIRGVGTAQKGLKIATSDGADVVVLDAELDDGRLKLLPELRKGDDPAEVVVISSAPRAESAEFAICHGAWDYLPSRPIDPVVAAVDQALQYRSEQQGEAPPVSLRREKIIGNSPLMKACLQQLGQAAASDVNVLIVGETGTGKELFARAIHSNSPRNRRGLLGRPYAQRSGGGSFVVVDCAALPENLVESILFGHVRGAFTGAGADHQGLIAQADGGTLFLDEVGELPLSVQKTFLRVLQERRFRPVGGAREKASSFRLIAATNRDLETMVARGRFRADLLYRLRAMTIELPPLRSRPEDIADLVRYHTRRLCDTYGIPTKGLSPDLLDMLATYHWPGNVRELINTIDSMLAAAGRALTLYPKHLPDALRIKLVCKALGNGGRASAPSAPADTSLPPYRQYREELEKRYLEALVRQTDCNMTLAARVSGISRSRLYELMAKHKLGPAAA